MTVLSIVIPAWNEAERLPGTLASLLAQEGVQQHVVVVVNGATDGTADAARQFVARFRAAGHTCTILELLNRSKCEALNAGERHTTAGLIAYMDADVLLGPGALAALTQALHVDEPRLAAPRLTVRAPPCTKALAEVWASLDEVSGDVAGGGLYAVNPSGRARWREFPIIIADDAFVRGRFQRRERFVLANVWFSVPFPKRDSLVPVLARWHAGNLQVGRGVSSPIQRLFRNGIVLLQRPWLWRHVLNWVHVRRLGRAEGARQLAAGDIRWPR